MMLPWLDLTTICRPVRFHMDSQVFPACQRETLLLPLCDIQSHNCLWVFQIPIAFFFHKNRSINSWVIVRLQPKRLYSCSQNFHCFHLDKTVFFITNYAGRLHTWNKLLHSVFEETNLAAVGSSLAFCACWWLFWMMVIYCAFCLMGMSVNIIFLKFVRYNLRCFSWLSIKLKFFLFFVQSLSSWVRPPESLYLPVFSVSIWGHFWKSFFPSDETDGTC